MGQIPKLPRRNIDGCFTSVSRHTKTALAVSADKSASSRSKQAGRCIADEQLGIATIRAQHLDRLVPGLIADFQKADATLDGRCNEPGSQAMRAERRHVEAKPGSASFHYAGNGTAV
jgi:hypothetical protein